MKAATKLKYTVITAEVPFEDFHHVAEKQKEFRKPRVTQW